MLLFVLLLWGQLNGIFGETHACSQSHNSMCNAERNEVLKIVRLGTPGTATEFHNFCTAFFPFTDCLTNYVNQCGTDGMYMLEVREGRLGKLTDLVHDACNRESQLYSSIIENIGCLKTMLDNQSSSCPINNTNSLWMPEGSLWVPERSYQDDVENSTAKRRDLCLRRAYKAACITEQASIQCGQAAKELVIDIIYRIGHLDFCQLQSRTEIISLFQLIGLEMEETVQQSGTFEESDICSHDYVSRCFPKRKDVDEIFRSGYPENKTDFDNFCLVFLPFADCMSNYINQCGTEGIHMIEVREGRMEKLTSLAHEACNRESALYSSIIKNIGCLKPIMDNYTTPYHEKCDLNNSNSLWTPEGSYHDDGENSTARKRDLCLHRAYEGACLAEQAFVYCGQAAKSLVMYITYHLGHLHFYCQLQSIKEMLLLLELIGLEIEENVNLPGLYGDTDICSHSHASACFPKPEEIGQILYMRNPGTREELKLYCSIFVPFVDCSTYYVNECGAEKVSIPEVQQGRLPKITNLVHDICNENSDLYTNLIQNIACLKPIMDSHTHLCDVNKRNILWSPEGSYDDKGEGDNSTSRKRDLCLHRVYTASCNAEQASMKCGRNAEKLVLDIAYRMGHLHYYCQLKSREEMLALLQLIGFVAEKEVEVPNLFNTLFNPAKTFRI